MLGLKKIYSNVENSTVTGWITVIIGVLVIRYSFPFSLPYGKSDVLDVLKDILFPIVLPTVCFAIILSLLFDKKDGPILYHRSAWSVPIGALLSSPVFLLLIIRYTPLHEWHASLLSLFPYYLLETMGNFMERVTLAIEKEYPNLLHNSNLPKKSPAATMARNDLFLQQDISVLEKAVAIAKKENREDIAEQLNELVRSKQNPEK